MADGLRLYVWDECFASYTDGLAFALAHDSEEARDLIAEQFGWRPDDLAKRPKVFPVDGQPVAFAVDGGS